ncbi:hypothetical protein LINGRAHAP2_LOCUS19263 [Linum grandiflorum]
MGSKSKAPVYPMPQQDDLNPPHFSDYGFDPQIDYFQLMEEVRKKHHQREDCTRFKLRKPISRDESSSCRKTTSFKKKRWWKKAIPFFNLKNWILRRRSGGGKEEDVHRARARDFRSSRASSSSSGPMDLAYVSLRELAMEQQHCSVNWSSVSIPNRGLA